MYIQKAFLMLISYILNRVKIIRSLVVIPEGRELQWMKSNIPPIQVQVTPHGRKDSRLMSL